MIKKLCDLCGKDMQSDKNLGESGDYVFNITHYGTSMDICVECRRALREWMANRRAIKGLIITDEMFGVVKIESEDKT